MSQKSAIKDWISAIAENAKLDVSKVEDILAEYRIEAMPVASTPKHLLLNRLRFTGTKIIAGVESPIDFHWDKLGVGLWAILSGENFRGKSTIIQVIRGCLRGNLSQSVQADVFAWLRTVDLDFQIDEQDFQLRLHLDDSLSGTLTRHYDSGRTRKVHSFEDEEEFEAAMSNFFMKHFDFDKFAVYRTQDEKGATVLHGWPALSAAMFIGTNYGTIIGELSPVSGIPVRLLQMFLGIPWVTTLASASAALKEEQRKQSASDQLNNDAKEFTERRLNELRDSLAEKQSQLAKTNETKQLQASLVACSESLQEAANREIDVRRRIRQATIDHEDAKIAVDEDRKALRSHEEESSAQTVFRALDPKNCPRCESSISRTRKLNEQSSNCCSVCGGRVHSDIDEAEIKRQLSSNLYASKKAQAEASKCLKELNIKLDEIKQTVASASSQQQKVARQMTRPTRRSGLLTEVAELNARIDELTKTIPVASTKSTNVQVLKIIENETRARMKEHQDNLLELISARILDYARRFGMTQLDSAKLLGNLNLPVVKSGSATSYGQLTAGEKLRLKIATLLALVIVGEEQNVGRYPGLLAIDSPAAQEVALKDLEQIISGLSEIAKEIGHLQVIVGSRSSPAICEQISEARSVQAMGTDYLW
ncbi:MAG: hypothetical protein KDB22_23630 [Planctomycetales bacterium]|nr:hypothetical protein [Planctomycetales bacterium]